jgi:YHS domain-containing protein
MNRVIFSLAAAVLAATLSLATPASAAASPEVSVEADGLGARGYDVTAYFTNGKAVRGNPAFQARYKGADWRFASADALSKFKANPIAFLPQFGGYCAWAVSQGYIAPGDPQQWKIVGGKLYLNFNARAKELWEADQEAAIVRANAHWPAVLTANQNSP